MTKQTVLYLFDPLCGWCYSVSGGMAKLAETADVKLVPTGLFSRNKIMSPDWSEHAWENDQRIARLTGLPFSEAYRRNILQQPTNFNSFPLVQALTAVQATEPERELEALRACQKARYEDGSDTAKLDVLADVLRQIGCTQAAEILTTPATEAQAKQRIADGANLARQFGVSGVPFAVRQTESGWAQIASDSLY